MSSSSSPSVDSSPSLQPADTSSEESNSIRSDPVSMNSAVQTIPAPVYLSNKLLVGEIFDSILTRTGLNSRERQILLAVLPSIPSDRQSQLHQILALPIDMLKSLARIYETALYAARNAGGGSKSSGTGSSNKRGSVDETPPLDSPETSKRPRFELVHRDDPAESASPSSVSILCDEPAALFPVAVEADHVNLLRALDIPNVLPLAPSGQPRFERRHGLATSLLARQGDTCPITGRSSRSGALVAAHLVPHSIAALKVLADTPYWILLTFVFGPALRDDIYRIAGGAKSCLPTNGIALDSSIHDMFDKGMIWLLPILAAPFDPETCTSYDVEFRWRGDLADLAAIATVLAPDVEDHVDVSGARMQYRIARLRQIEDRDRFRLFTNDPASCPLPHPLLLELHGRLWNMISCAGIGTTANHRKAHEATVKRGGTTPSSARSARRAHGSRHGSAQGSGRGSRRGTHTASPRNPPIELGNAGDTPASRTGFASGGALAREAPLLLKSEFLLFRLSQVVDEGYVKCEDSEDGSDGDSDSGSDCEWLDSVNGASCPGWSS